MKEKERERKTRCSKLVHEAIERESGIIGKVEERCRGQEKQEHRFQKEEKEAKVSLVKRMEAKKENYIKELECSRGVMVLGCWYATWWAPKNSPSLFPSFFSGYSHLRSWIFFRSDRCPLYKSLQLIDGVNKNARSDN